MKTPFKWLAAFAAVTLAACQTNSETVMPEKPQEPVEQPARGAKVQIAFVAAHGTRAFGDNAAEAWEKAISDATILVFNAEGKIKFRRSLSAAELGGIAATPISLVIPDVAVGETCNFVVVANRTIPTTVTTKALLAEQMENDAATYNGSFGDVTTKAVRPAGFVMTGSAAQAIAEGTTAVSITLKRVVAKIELTAATTTAFAQKYGPGTITVDRVTLSRGAIDSYLMDLTTAKFANGGSTFTHTQQTVEGKNLFYIYEKAASAEGARVLLTLVATYDADGAAATQDDRIPVFYEVELTGADGGRIIRNGAYVVKADIDGLTGNDISVTVNVSDWATVITQNTHVGN